MQRLINASLILVLFGLVILWAGCGPTTEPRLAETSGQVTTTPGVVTPTKVGEIEVPDWFLNIPESPDHFYAASTDSSKDMQHALDIAKQAALTDISRQLQTKVSGLFKRFTEEVGIGEDSEVLAMTTAVSKDVVSDVLKIARTLKQDVKKDSENVYRAYVLMELSVGEMNAAFMDKVKKDENMYTRFRESQAFKELEAEVEKYEQWKKDQGQG